MLKRWAVVVVVLARAGVASAQDVPALGAPAGAPQAPPVAPQPVQPAPPVQAAPVAPPVLSGPAPAPSAPPAPLQVAAPPSSLPVVFLVLGGLSTAAGVANLATSPLCETSSLIRSEHRTACLATSIGVGIGLLAAGVPMLVVGAQRRAAVQRVGLTVLPTTGGAVAAWSASW
jgi:hypothetical protein